jgi:hypothetical protein
MLAATLSTVRVDQLEVAKWWLVGIYVLSTIGVIVGVYWEGHKFDSDAPKQERGWRLLLISLGAESLFGILIFASDGWINQIQRSEIISLEKMLMPRRWYGPFSGSVRGSPTVTGLFKMMGLVSELSKYPKTSALIQFVPDFDAQKLAILISQGLTIEGWSPQLIEPAKSGISSLDIPDGVQLWTRAEHDDAWRAAEALAASLSYEGIEAQKPTAKLHRDDPSQIALPNGDIRKSPPVGSVVILIGEKPGFLELLEKQDDEYRAAHTDEK